MEKRIEKELQVNDEVITEERLNNIAADFLPKNAGEQETIEKEIEIENMIITKNGRIER